MRVAMLLHKSVVRDSRVRREAATLAAEGHDVVVLEMAAVDTERLDGFRRRSVLPPGRLRRLPLHLHRVVLAWTFARGIVRERPDVIHAHDAAMLVPGLLGARITGARLVYDTHELATGVPYRDGFWAWFVDRIERLGLPRVAAVITVSDGIAARLVDRYALRVTPVVLRNVCDLSEAGDGGLRARVGVAPGIPLVLHQGAPAPGRGCDVLVRAMAHVPDAHLVFLGDASPASYGAELATLADASGLGGRVHFTPSVPLADLLAHTAEADVGVTLLQDTCENHRLALPNKLFEYLAAGVPVVASALPELSRVVAGHSVGTTVDQDDPVAVGAGIREVLDARAADPGLLVRVRDAGDALSWRHERGRLLDLYAALADRARERLISPTMSSPRPIAVQLVRNGVTHDARVLRAAHVLLAAGYDVRVVGVVAGDAIDRHTVIDGITVQRLAPTSLGTLRRRIRRGGRRPAGTVPSSAPTDPSPAATAAPGAGGGPAAVLDGVTARVGRLVSTVDFYRLAVAHLGRVRPVLVHANDYNTMWPALVARARWGTRVVYDSHELWSDRNGRREWRRWLLACEWLFVRLADTVITASPGYSRELGTRYRVTSPAVIRNIPEATAPDPGPAGEAGTSPPSLITYVGGLMPGRGLEEAIAALALAPGVRLRVMGPGPAEYAAGLVALAERRGVRERLELAAPVGPTDVVASLRGAAGGLLLIQPICRSYELTLPNKLFEYAAAGLPMLTSDLEVLGDVVRRHGLGEVVAPTDVPAIAAAMLRLCDGAVHADLAANTRDFAARETWQAEAIELAAVYREVRG